WRSPGIPWRARRDRPKLSSSRVGATHDARGGLKRRIGELEFLEEGIERAPLAVVSELDPRNVVRDGAIAFCDHPDLIGGDEEERRFFVDEMADTPGASDPIDTSSFLGVPLHRRATASPPHPISCPPPSCCWSARARLSIPGRA